MKLKLFSKIGTTLLCGVFVATMVTGPAFAAEPNAKNTINTNKLTILEEMDNSVNKSTSSNKNVGSVSTSIYDGSTRTQGVTNGSAVANNSDSIIYKTENGITYYSTDGGETWTKMVSQEAPVKKDTDSNTSSNGKQVTNQVNTRTQVLPNGSAMVNNNDNKLYKTENGITYYSTDRGVTWTKMVSQEVPVKKDIDSNTSINGKQIANQGNTWNQGLSNWSTVMKNNNNASNNSNNSNNVKQFTSKNNTWSQGFSSWSIVNNDVVKKNNGSKKTLYYNIVHPNKTVNSNNSTSGSNTTTEETVVLIYLADGVYYYSTDQGQNWTEITVSEGVSVDENSNIYYTTDGETWTDGLPDGLTMVEDEDGNLYIIEVTVLIYLEDGIYYCSIDQGENWTEITASEGVSIYENSNYYYTTDGETWTQGIPDGLTVEEDEDGNIYIVENDS